MLFSVADYKTRFGVSGTAQDAKIEMLALSVTAALANRGAAEDDGTAVTEIHDGDGSGLVTLKRRPIISVTSVKVDAGRVFGAETQLLAADYEVLNGSGVIRLHGAWLHESTTAAPFGTMVGAIHVVYRGGWQSIPFDLKEGAMLWAFYINAKTPGVTSETIGAYSATYEQATAGAMPREVKSFLGPYLSVNTGRRL